MTLNSDQVRIDQTWVPPTSHLPHPVLRAGNGTRTRDPNLGKVVLYQLSYSREHRRPARTGMRQAGVHATRSVSVAMEARGIEPLTS